MNSTSIQETLLGFEVIFKATKELYESYFKSLEAAIKNTPDSAVERLRELNDLVQEGYDAVEHDMAIFDKVSAMDMEDLLKMDDELKIQSLYNKLKANGIN